MRWSHTFIPTLREVPRDAVAPSHALMLKAGYLRQVARGTYTYLPLGWRSLRKAEQIVREEMDRAGALEIHMPALQPLELWQKTKRDIAYGPLMFKFTDRRGEQNVLGPTHEEVVTSLVADNIDSYKQLPITLYQIQTKFRDEIRPRFGLMRAREFLMKDAYSFDPDIASLDASYQAMFKAYHRIFARAGLNIITVEADSGAIGGESSCEFMVPSDTGEDVIVFNRQSGYSANLERAETRAVPASYPPENPRDIAEAHTPGTTTIEHVSEFLGLTPDRLIKTLIFTSTADNGSVTPFIVLIRGDHEANEVKISHLYPDTVVEMADETVVRNITGAAVGFAGPVGLKIDVPVYADHSIRHVVNGATGANKTDYHLINVNPGRDFEPLRYGDFRNAQEGDTDPDGEPLSFARGVEVGHVFKLGKKYSTALNASFLTRDQTTEICWMGCYGIGVDRIVAAAIEQHHDDAGIILPMAIAPYHVIITPLNAKDDTVRQAADTIYQQCLELGVDVLYDDRTVRAGVKFNDADLIGVPWRITVGGRGVKKGVVEFKRRGNADVTEIAIDKAAEAIRGIVDDEMAALNAAVESTR